MFTIIMTALAVTLLVVFAAWAWAQVITAIIHRPDRDHEDWQPPINLAEWLIDRHRQRNN